MSGLKPWHWVLAVLITWTLIAILFIYFLVTVIKDSAKRQERKNLIVIREVEKTAS